MLKSEPNAVQRYIKFLENNCLKIKAFNNGANMYMYECLQDVTILIWCKSQCNVILEGASLT